MSMESLNLRLGLAVLAITVVVFIARSAAKNWSWSDRRNYLRTMSEPEPDERSSILQFKRSHTK